MLDTYQTPTLTRHALYTPKPFWIFIGQIVAFGALLAYKTFYELCGGQRGATCHLNDHKRSSIQVT